MKHFRRYLFKLQILANVAKFTESNKSVLVVILVKRFNGEFQLKNLSWNLWKESVIWTKSNSYRIVFIGDDEKLIIYYCHFFNIQSV